MDSAGITGLTPEAEEFLDSWNDDRDYIVAFTSGSTGKPKEIRLLKSDMIASAKATNAFLGINASSTLALPLSASYIAGKMMIVRSIVAQCPLYITEPDADPLLGLPQSIRFSLIPIVPAQIQGLVSYGELSRRIGAIIVGGAPTTPRQDGILKNLGIPVFATYGMTETCSHVALRPIGEDAFTAMPGIEFGVDARGCLIISAPQFSFGKIITNDCVTLLSPTRFRWLGRADNVINSGGIKIHPESIEKILAPLFVGRAFYVASRPSERWGSEIIIFVEGNGFDIKTFMASAAKFLDRKLMPKEVIEIERFERTASGKVVRR
ncbi:MAG: AMP-binding protein [Paramuribaculum sp.]|nr:AMP-binding protein [Paramuribaculum sp.]